MADEESGVPKEEKRGRRWILWVLTGILGVVVSGFGGYGLVRYYQGVPAPAEEGDESPAQEGNGEAGAGLHNVKSMMELEAFLVNLADRDSARFVKATFRLGMDQPNLGEELANDPVILAATRDRIISILTTKMSEQILTLEGKDRLRSEIRDGVNAILPDGKVVEVYIMDFVVQL